MPLDALNLDHKAAAGLMDLWTRIHWSSGDGMMPPEQLYAIYRWAVTWHGRGDIVELGSWVGLTTSYLATACRVRGEGRVHAVDTFEGTKEGGGHYSSIEKYDGSTLAAFRGNIHRAGVDDLVNVMVGYTSDAAQQYRGRPIRLLLIDADHSFAAVKRDFQLWSPMVMPGGLIVFHDYLMEDVARFVDTEVAPDARFELTPGHAVPNVMAITKRPNVGRVTHRPRRDRRRADETRREAATV
jgi:predicted O-methyltransferase YrrM